MSTQNQFPLIFAFIILLAIASLQSSHCSEKNRIICQETEKRALLSFKRSVEDPTNALSSWNPRVDCCEWDRVFCDNTTGHVLALHLQADTSDSYIGGKLDSSLLALKHLRYLDLSWNSFQGTVPSFIGSFPCLEYLDLSTCSFQGTVPPTLGNLSSLRTLNLQDNVLDANNMEWLRGLSRLERLNMNSVNLSRASGNWAEVVNSLPSLVELHLHSCGLNSVNNDLADNNISSSLATLDLSGNDFHSLSVPKWIYRLNKLVYLDLNYNGLEGPIPSIVNFTGGIQHIDLSFNNFNSTLPDWLYSCNNLEFMAFNNNSLDGTISKSLGNLTSLVKIDLSFNGFSGEIPREIVRLCRLQSLDLSVNNFQGEVSNLFETMSDCFGTNLESLHLAYNYLSGHLPDQFGEKFRRLQTLHLRSNSFSGPIPTSLGKLSSLYELRVENNKFNGSLPESFGQLSNLAIATLHNNLLEGTVTENHFANLTSLTLFVASGNPMTLKVNENWAPPFKLTHLGMGSWNLGTGIAAVPRWLEGQKDYLEKLDLSNTAISFDVPKWLWEIPRFNLSHNKLHSRVPDIIDSITGIPRAVYLSFNQFNGPLPRVSENVEALDLSNNSFSGGLTHFLCNTTAKAVEFLHLGGNMLSGELPDCWTNWSALIVLNLEDNNFSGRIPNSMGVLVDLQSLDLHKNNLSGPIPSSMRNCTNLRKIDLSDNLFVGNIPEWMGVTPANLRFLILSSNKLSGEISPNICRLNSLQILNLSNNKFSGTIPDCVDNFTAMATTKSTELVGYKFDYAIYSEGIFAESASVITKGSEYKYDTILALVTNIDFSENNFSGDIPKQLTSLVELRSLNLSGNRFTGMIPDNIGDMKQLESLDLSRNSISGEIPGSLAALTYLSSLNLSYNNLVGPVPQSTQLLSLPVSSFIGNRLCGPPLTSNCISGGGIPSPDDQKKHDGSDRDEFRWIYLFVSFGYAVGFSTVITLLILKRSWRDAYYGFFEDLWNKLCRYS